MWITHQQLFNLQYADTHVSFIIWVLLWASVQELSRVGLKSPDKRGVVTYNSLPYQIYVAFPN